VRSGQGSENVDKALRYIMISLVINVVFSEEGQMFLTTIRLMIELRVMS
jgi:hypothetical protein